MRIAAVGKPQAIMSEEELAEKEANRTGASVNSKVSGSTRSQSRSLAGIMAAGEKSHSTQSRSRRSSASELSRHGDEDESTIVHPAADGGAKRGMILPFQPLSISFDDVSYYVDMPAEMKSAEVTESKLQLLTKITGAFRPGVLTALVGVSGAG